MNKTRIEYLTHTWNPMHGCSPISPGCKNCWAKSMAKRLAAMGMNGYSHITDPFKVALHPERLVEPLEVNFPARIGVAFMGDLFHEDVPFSFIVRVFHVMAEASHHTFLVLTKRPEIMADFFEWWNFEEPLSNVWLGVTVENQEEADKRIPLLLQIPAAKRFVSVEPMLGAVDLTKVQVPESDMLDTHKGAGGVFSDSWKFNALDMSDDRQYYNPPAKLDWVVCGGESGKESRPCHPEWVRDLRDQCKAAGVPFMFKQWGEYRPGPEFLKDYVIVDFQGNVFEPGQVPSANGGRLAAMQKVGKKAAGHLIDEYEKHMEMPVWL